MRFYLSAGINILYLSDDPAFSFSNQKKISCSWLFLYNRHSCKIAFHQYYSRPIRNTNKFPIIFGFPKELLTIISKNRSYTFSPYLTIFFEAEILQRKPSLSLFLHFLKRLDLKLLLLDFFQNIKIINLYNHSFTHSHIRQQKRILLNVLNKNKLSTS